MPTTRIRVALAAVVACVSIGVVAVIDHSRKERAVQAANVSAWYCAHGRASRCVEVKPWTLEHSWLLRERLYQGGVGLGAAVALALVAIEIRHRRAR
jgi:hypothetical protein